MRIAYLGKTSLSDVDISYLAIAQKKANIDYFLEITPRYLKGAAICIDKIYPRSGIFKATDIYPQFLRFQNIIDLNHVFIVNTCGKKTWVIKSFWTNFLFLIYLIRNKYNAIHVTWPLNIYELSLYALRKKMVITVHDPTPHSGRNTTLVRIRRWFAFKFIHRFILLNKTQRDDFIKKYNLSKKEVINSSLGAYYYLKAIPQLELSDLPDKYFLFFGQIAPHKGIEYLLEATRKVHKYIPNQTLIIAGKGNYYFDISPYINKSYIKIINRFIPDEELASLIEKSEFIVCPYTDATQSGVVMSAFAFNKPVLATNVGSIPEIVIHNHYGIVVNARDPDALGEGLLLMLEKSQYFSDNIRSEYSAGKHSWNNIANSLIEEYAKI